MGDVFVWPTHDMELKAELLMVGSCSATHRLGMVVVRVARIDCDPEITRENAKAIKVEINAYRILGVHERIATCLYLGPTGDMIVLRFYSTGDLKNYITAHGPSKLLTWAKQMIEAVEYIHSKGVRHSDIKLCQWLLDSKMNARLSDFNGCGYDAQPLLGISSMEALSYERQSHFMLRDSWEDSSIKSDLFALGSALYELEHRSIPFVEVSEDEVTEYFMRGNFPSVSGLTLGHMILGCWQGQYNSATEMLQAGERLWLT